MIKVTIKKDSKWRNLYAPEPHIRYVLVYGPRLGGKSYRASQAAILQMTSWNYFRGYIMRNVLDNVRDSIFQDCWDRVNEFEMTPVQVAESNLQIKWRANELKGRGFK
jgi:phage terminase large subunit